MSELPPVRTTSPAGSSTGPTASSPRALDDISLDSFEVHGMLGEGQFGRVMMVTRRANRQLYAMKCVLKEKLLRQGQQSVAQALSEKRVLEHMASRPHPFVVSLQFAFQDVDHLYLVMDYVGGGDMFTLLEQQGSFPEEWARVYAGEIVLALEHVHGSGVVYRDLKPENVMVGIDGHLKLTDFGMSKETGGEGGRPALCGTICGTPEYIAPEAPPRRHAPPPRRPAAPPRAAPRRLARELTPEPPALDCASRCCRAASTTPLSTGGPSAASSLRCSPATSPPPSSALRLPPTSSPRGTHAAPRALPLCGQASPPSATRVCT